VKPEIQSGLWRMQLNPEISSWDEVLSQAEIIEISENMAYQQEHRTGTSKSQQDSLFMPSFPILQNNPPLPNVRASRFMTFKSRRHQN
jgi:hypothetical protein